jgi:serine phosphatase RsbU (regulator of sigma subunit)
VTIARGSSLVLFSDGLVERKTELVDTGLARLAECARELRESTCDEFSDGLLARLYDGAVAGDDVALLVVELVSVRAPVRDPVERARSATGKDPPA